MWAEGESFHNSIDMRLYRHTGKTTHTFNNRNTKTIELDRNTKTIELHLQNSQFNFKWYVIMVFTYF